MNRPAGQPDATNILFVTWDGPGSTYLAGLFLPIFVALADRGFRFHVLQFTWAHEAETRRIGDQCRAAGIAYRAAPIWRRPVSAGGLVSAIAGRGAVRSCIADWAIDGVMPRSYLPALAAIPVAKARGRSLPILLDADGLPNDERIDFAGAAGGSLSHRLLARIERWAVRHADAVTVRTDRAGEILRNRACNAQPAQKFVTVNNARDEALFRPSSKPEIEAGRSDLGIAADAPLLGYVGSSLSGKYLGSALVEFVALVLQRRGDTRLLVIMPDPREAEVLLADAPAVRAATVFQSVAATDVPKLIGAADLGLSLIRSSPSMQAASAIKTGEYLLCGVPVLATAGVGGVEQYLPPSAGLCIADVGEATLAQAADWFVTRVLADRAAFAASARETGLRHFALSTAIDDYDRALRLAMERAPRR